MTQAPLLDLPLPAASSANPTVWTQLYGAAPSLAAAEAIARHEGTVCIVTQSAAAAEQLERELAFFNRTKPLRRFPDYETLPYESIAPPQDLLADRLSALYDLAAGKPLAMIVNADALLNRLPPPEYVVSRSLKLSVGDRIDRTKLTSRLIEQGYLRVEQVTEPGEFAVRGSLMDVFPSGAPDPVRIDFFDDDIEALRRFDTQDQRSLEKTKSIQVLPAREFPFDRDGIRGFRERFREHFPGEPGRCPVYKDISEAQLPAGIEYFLPLFFDRSYSLFDYLPEDTLLILVEDALDGLHSGWELICTRYEQLRGDLERPILAPELGFWPPDVLSERVGRCARLLLSTRDGGAADENSHVAGTAHPLTAGVDADPDRIDRWLSGTENDRTLLLASSPGRREVLIELLKSRGYRPKPMTDWPAFLASNEPLAVAVGDFEQGLRLPARGIRIVTGRQLGLERPRQSKRRRRPARDPEAVIRELTDLQVGAPVVHEEYGIGRYRGLSTLEVDDTPTEFLLLEYAGGDKLYVPVHSLHLVTRYTGASPEQAPLHRLGSDQWLKAKRKAAKQARDVAAELLNLYAQRAARVGTRIEADEEAYQRFALEFPFEETEDQSAAIRQVVDDMSRDAPMDRIVCGDVGFGKTEVAMRAAFIAAHAGFQVAVLVPTTLLAQQHFRSFSDRFADWPVEIELLSRFRGSKESRAILDRIAAGTIDIVIGTHKLLQSDARFKSLGLVIVDEEHRFGVKHKDRLKKLKAEVDVLTMTATPIPRTLNMSLGGLRDLSIIATPPAERLSVKTFVGEWADQTIKEAVLREIRRGGQVYFVHNRVENIEAVAERLEKLLPETELRIAHGQMSERALEDVMLDFYHRRFAVLVCTTIIESGIDIPTANTIIIDRADRLGLAQLHQLRGRVGRSHHQAYAYLLAPPVRALTADAAKRLEAIAALEELGSGFALATHDLEIRGAGELLGEGQSGQIQAIGFSLYNELLSRAIVALREGKEPDLEDPFAHGPEIEAGIVALIPEDYMPDVHVRLVHYKRIASAASDRELEELQVELIDRFGLIPDAARNLFAITNLKLLAQRLGIEKIRAGSIGGVLRFGERSVIDPVALVGLIESDPSAYRLDGQYKLRFNWPAQPENQRIDALKSLLIELGATKNEAAAA